MLMPVLLLFRYAADFFSRARRRLAPRYSDSQTNTCRLMPLDYALLIDFACCRCCYTLPYHYAPMIRAMPKLRHAFFYALFTTRVFEARCAGVRGARMTLPHTYEDEEKRSERRYHMRERRGMRRGAVRARWRERRAALQCVD